MDGQAPYNITPDVVATVLGAITGTMLGGFLPLAFNFISSRSTFIWATLLLLIAIAAAFAWMCRHMELAGWRLMRQAYSLTIPLVTVFFIAGLVSQRIFGVIGEQIVMNDVATGGAGGQSLGSIIGQQPFTTLQLILLCVGMAAAVLVIFFAEARRQEHMRLRWFWPLLVPVVLCALSWWIVGST